MSLESQQTGLKQVIELVSKDKGVDKKIVIHAIVLGILGAIRKKYGTYRDIEAKYNEELGEIELFEFKKVVPDKDLEDDLIEIKHSEAVQLDPEVQLEEQIGTSLDMQSFGRIHVQTAMQTMFQDLRKAEHDIIFAEFEKRKGEVVSGIVRRVDPGMIVVDVGKTEAYIPRREQIQGEEYKSGDRIQGYLSEVRQTTKGPRIIMSRAHEQYLIKLFEVEVPEVYEGIVKIVGAAREPGQRAKMAVYSTDPSVHPVGACVGVKGTRVQNITQELKGERIDVIVWEDEPVQYVVNALAPAKISTVFVDEDNKQMQVIVDDDQLSLAIGKKGQNVRLAVKLTGWNLNLISDQQKKAALYNLALLPSISEIATQNIFQYGYLSVKDIADANPLDIESIPGFDNDKKAKDLIVSAQRLVDEYEAEGKEFPQLESTVVKKTEEAGNLKEQAEEILKRELAQLDNENKEDTKQEATAKDTKQEAATSEETKQEATPEDTKQAATPEDTKQEADVESKKDTKQAATPEDTKQEATPEDTKQEADVESKKDTEEQQAATAKSTETAQQEDVSTKNTEASTQKAISAKPKKPKKTKKENQQTVGEGK